MEGVLAVVRVGFYCPPNRRRPLVQSPQGGQLPWSHHRKVNSPLRKKKTQVIRRGSKTSPVRRGSRRHSHPGWFWPGCRPCSRCSWRSPQQEAGTEESCTTTHTPCGSDLWPRWKERQQERRNQEKLAWTTLSIVWDMKLNSNWIINYKNRGFKRTSTLLCLKKTLNYSFKCLKVAKHD